MTETTTTAATVSERAGMRTFMTVWAGQLVSITGSSLTGFALQIWVYLETGSVTQLALVTLALALPSVLLAPVAGAFVDRWDRRLTMLGADVLAGLGTLGIATLYLTGTLAVWHVYLLIGLGALGNTFQAPAWMASVPLLVPKRHLGRANGMVQVAEAVGLISAPAIAGALLATLGLGAVLVADAGTFAVAVATLGIVRFPRPERTADSRGGSVWDDVRIGWRFIRDRAGLIWLLGMYAGVNFVLSFTNVLIIPLIVSFATESAAGGVLSAAGVGMLLGSTAISAWGGPDRRVAGVVVSILLAGLFVALTGLRPSLALIGAGGFLLMFVTPAANTMSQVLWQLKVPPALQGRVFALRRTVAQGISPIAILTAGPLADGVFEPLMAEDGALADSVGRIIGTGPGRGIGLMVILSGFGVILIGIAGWLHPRVRRLEDELPDHLPDDVPGVEPGAPGRAPAVAEQAGPAAPASEPIGAGTVAPTTEEA